MVRLGLPPWCVTGTALAELYGWVFLVVIKENNSVRKLILKRTVTKAYTKELSYYFLFGIFAYKESSWNVDRQKFFAINHTHSFYLLYPPASHFPFTLFRLSFRRCQAWFFPKGRKLAKPSWRVFRSLCPRKGETKSSERFHQRVWVGYGFTCAQCQDYVRKRQ